MKECFSLKILILFPKTFQLLKKKKTENKLIIVAQVFLFYHYYKQETPLSAD